MDSPPTRPLVVFLSQFFRPETNAASNRVASFLTRLSSSFDVKLVTLRPSYPTPEHFRDVAVDDSGWSFDIVRTRTFDPHEGSFAQRAAREQVMAIGLARAARAFAPDAVIATSPSMFLGPAALALARLKKSVFVWDIRDLTWDYAVGRANGRTSSALARFLRRGLLNVARRADHLLVTNQGQASALQAAGVPSDRITVVRNGVERGVIATAAAGPGASDGARKVTYAGVLGFNQGLLTLIHAAKLLEDLDVQIVLAGEGAERGLLEEEVDRLRLSNVSFPGYLDKRSLMELYASSDVLVSLLRRDVSKTATPSKLIEYMALGKPVVYAGEGDGMDLIRDAGGGVAVAPESPTELAAAIRDLLSDQEGSHRMGIDGQDYVKRHLLREDLAETVAEVIDSLLAGKKERVAG